MCINCLHVYLEKTKSPQKQQPWQQPALFLAGGCNCVEKGGAETSPGLLLSAADMPGLDQRLRRTLLGSTRHVPCSVSIAPAPWWGISREHRGAMSSPPSSGSSSCVWDITGLGRQWLERCPLIFPGSKQWQQGCQGEGKFQAEADKCCCCCSLPFSCKSSSLLKRLWPQEHVPGGGTNPELHSTWTIPVVPNSPLPGPPRERPVANRQD